MVQYVERVRTPGRNDPCMCGSGKKYKRCCLVHDAVHVTVRNLADIMAEIYEADEIGDWGTVITILQEARSTVRDVDLDNMLVERYLQLDLQEAENKLRAWWEQEHDRFSGTGLAQTLVKQDRRGEAFSVLNESQGIDAPPDYWRLLATLRDEHAETEAAIAAMELYARLVPEDADAWLTLADMQQRAGQNDRALLSLRRAGDVVPDRLLPRMLRVRILSEEARWREVRDLAENLIDGEYDDATDEIRYELRDMLAHAYFMLGDFDAARHLLEDLLDRRPHDGNVRYRLAQLELVVHRHRRALIVLDQPGGTHEDLRVLDVRLQCLLALHEYGEALTLARTMDDLDPSLQALPLVQAAEAVSSRDYVWALERLEHEPSGQYRHLWNNLRLDCLAHLGRWHEALKVLKAVDRPDDTVLLKAALLSMAAGKLDVSERLLQDIEDQQSIEVRSVVALLGPLRQSRRAVEVRRQQQIDETERQRRVAENRELRKRVRDLERHNAVLADSLTRAEVVRDRLQELIGVSSECGVPADWEEQLQSIRARAHKDALAQELRQAELRLRSMLGDSCWGKLSESARVALREGEWLFEAVEGEDRDYGASFLEYARGLESAFKDSIFCGARRRWELQSGPVDRLADEGHDPSLGPFVRFILQNSHLTLGSMAAALDRMSDRRRQGVAITLLRQQVGIDVHDTRALEDWKHIAERLALAAEARNQPAHAGGIRREAVCEFREVVLGTDGILRALDM